MLQSVRKVFMFVAALAALAAGAAAFAGAAPKNSASSSSSSQRDRQRSSRETELSGDTADKVKAAALAKVPGASVLRVEAGGPDGSAYHAHVRKSDGSEVVVLVNSSFEATAIDTHGGPGHRGGRGGRHGGPGRHGDETALTGDIADKVKAAALAKVAGGTVLRVESDADHGSPYEAHVRKSDGSEVELLVNKDFEVTAVNEHRGRP
ncbi:MAG: hypothetical protein QOD83_686 [Solirubrobacteraceae bacterium]|nr:hypothetical protein [Solirubrobacteraceae bacterium]